MVFIHVNGIFCPDDLSIMITVILVPSATQYKIKLVFFVVNRPGKSVIMVVEPFLLHKICVADCIPTNNNIGQTIGRKAAIVLILFVITSAAHIEECCVYFPELTDLPCIKELVMVLLIVISFVFVSIWIVGSVRLKRIFWNTCPCLVCFFLAGKDV